MNRSFLKQIRSQKNNKKEKEEQTRVHKESFEYIMMMWIEIFLPNYRVNEFMYTLRK